MKKTKINIKGFTLVEIILTIVIVGIIAGVTAKILMSGLDTYSFVVNRKDITQQARVSMDRMVSELMLIDTSDINLMQNTIFAFDDRDGTPTSFGLTTYQGEPILVRGDGYNMRPLAHSVGFIDFDYLKPDGSSTTVVGDVRRINIELSLDAYGGYGSIALRTEVFPRNFMYQNFQ